MKASRESAWVLLGLLGGILGVVVLAAILRKEIAGSVPLAPKSGRTQRQKNGYCVLGASALMFAVLFVVPGSVIGWFILAFFVLLIAGGGMVLVNHGPVKAELSQDQTLVTLKGVHPNFAQGVQAMMMNQFASPPPPPGVPMVQPPFQMAPPMPHTGYSGLPPVGAPATVAPAPYDYTADPFRT